MSLITVLNKLMEDQGLSLDKLSKLTGVSRSNINRMKTDENCNPTISSLLPIAKFFKISVEQLIGAEPISNTHKYELNSLRVEKLPILSTYEHISQFVDGNRHPKNVSFTYAENTVSENSFGYITTDDTMEPYFPKNIIVIFDPSVKYEDQSYVLVKNSKNQIYFKKYVNQDNLEFLTSLKTENGQTKLLKLNNDISIIATAVECHMDLSK